MKITLFGWGFSIRRHFIGGISNPVTWVWQLTLHWKLYNFKDSQDGCKGWWWYDRCFYTRREHLATPKQVGTYLERILPILEAEQFGKTL